MGRGADNKDAGGGKGQGDVGIPRKGLKEVEEEMPTGVWKAPSMIVGDVSVPVKKKRERLCSLGTRRTSRWFFSSVRSTRWCV